EKAPLKDELSVIAKTALKANAFIGVKPEQYGEAQKAALSCIEEGVTDSIIVSGVLPELLSNASNAWINGGSFFGMAKPETPELVSSAVDQLLKIFSTSDKENFPRDLHTLVGLGDALIDSGILASLGNNEQLMLVLEKDGVVASLTDPLYKNERMTPLVREIVNIGLRASASILAIPENKEEVYTNFTDVVAEELNAMSELSLEEMSTALSVKMDEICESFAIVATDTEKQVLSIGMAYEFNGRSDITGTEIADFFEEYTAYMENEGEDITTYIVPASSVRFINYTENEEEAGDMLVTTFKNSDIILIAPAPEKAEKKSGAAYAAVLMKLIKESQKAEPDDEQAQIDFRASLLEETLQMSDSFENSELLANIIEEKIAKDKENEVKIEPVLAAKPESFPTRIPVIEEILFDESFAPNVNEDEGENETEYSASAVAVEKIAKSVSSLVNVLKNNESIGENMVAIMEKTGTILDGIAEISTDGEEKATLLTKSIFASDLIASKIPVSKNVLIDMAETLSNEVVKEREEAKKDK
ncbi:MAG: hypothetical protein IIV11_04365, partial [Clostridia bacterium]|nr:hypothetical protein [Clostridia bacterium]